MPLDIENSSVLGIVSKPDADVSHQNTLQNYMLTPIYPGSVFKQSLPQCDRK